MKRFAILTSTLFLTLSSFASINPKLTCSFTEPFYDLELDLDSGKLIRVEYDWNDSDPNSDYIRTVLNKNSIVTINSSGKTLSISVKDIKTSESILDSKLDYKGSDGMSNALFPLSVKHFDKQRGTQYGGCELDKILAYDSSELDKNMKKFANYASQGIQLCMARAKAEWTQDPSDYDSESTKFFVLYSQQPVPGEAGEISQTFASAEMEVLYKSVLKTKIPPEDGASLNQLKSAMWDHCQTYAELIQSRYINK